MVILVVFNSFNVVKNLKKPDRVARQMPPLYTTYCYCIVYYFSLKSCLETRNNIMTQEEEVTNAKLLGAILDLKNNINKNSVSITQIMQNLGEIKNQQDDIKKDLLFFKTNTQASIRALETAQQTITQSQEFINTEFEKFKKQLSETTKRAESGEAKVVSISAELPNVKDDNTIQQSNLNDLEQYSRRSMLEVNNIPVDNKENFQDIMTAIAKAINFEEFDYANDVDVAHRLKSNLPVPPIIVMFKSRSKRNAFYEKRKKLKGVTLKDLELTFTEEKSIYINELLTIYNRILFKKVRSACKAKHYKHYWTSNGNILCKKTDQSDAIIIKNERD